MIHIVGVLGNTALAEWALPSVQAHRSRLPPRRGFPLHHLQFIGLPPARHPAPLCQGHFPHRRLPPARQTAPVHHSRSRSRRRRRRSSSSSRSRSSAHSRRHPAGLGWPFREGQAKVGNSQCTVLVMTSYTTAAAAAASTGTRTPQMRLALPSRPGQGVSLLRPLLPALPEVFLQSSAHVSSRRWPGAPNSPVHHDPLPMCGCTSCL